VAYYRAKELCALCKTRETELHEYGVPICIACSNERDANQTGPYQATRFTRYCCNIYAAPRSGLKSPPLISMPQCARFRATYLPDGTLHISNTNRALAAARNEMMDAHNRLNDFLARGIVPDDLKSREE
jgi:hypothetical protein